LLIWLFIPAKDTNAWNIADYGLWTLMPKSLQTGHIGIALGILFTTATVYAMVEFSNSMVLLNTNSRMLSCTLTLLMALSLCLHKFQPVHIVMFCSIISYFTLFGSYQNESPAHSFATHLMIATASLVFPKFIFFSVLAWLIQLYLNAFSPQVFFASLFAMTVPYWFFFTYTVCSDQIDLFTQIVHETIDIKRPSIADIGLLQWIAAFYIALTFLSGVINFILTNSNDRIRQRSIFTTFIFHGFIVIFMAFMMTKCFNVFLGLLAIDAAIIGGRFWVVTNNRFTHYFFIIMALLAAIVLALSFNI
jgi:hypothetical protein